MRHGHTFVLADAGKGDLILCQITSNTYADPRAIELTDSSFDSGSLRVVSYARPAKLFTANRSLLVAQVGVLTKDTLKQITETLIKLLREEIK